MYSRDLGERVNRGDKRGVTRPPRILFLPFSKREARLHLSWRRGGVLRRNCERIQPAIGRCIPADLSAALSPPATGLRYRWSFPIFYTGAGDLSARFATLARLAPPPPIISDRPTLPVGQRLETDSRPPRPVLSPDRLPPRFVYCPSRRRTLAFSVRSFSSRTIRQTSWPGIGGSLCFVVWKEKDNKIERWQIRVKFPWEIHPRGVDEEDLGIFLEFFEVFWIWRGKGWMKVLRFLPIAIPSDLDRMDGWSVS